MSQTTTSGHPDCIVHMTPTTNSHLIHTTFAPNRVLTQTKGRRLYMSICGHKNTMCRFHLCKTTEGHQVLYLGSCITNFWSKDSQAGPHACIHSSPLEMFLGDAAQWINFHRTPPGSVLVVFPPRHDVALCGPNGHVNQLRR